MHRHIFKELEVKTTLRIKPPFISGHSNNSLLEAKSQLEKAQAEIGLDESKPKGQIQIREPGGQSFVGEFNTTSTVEDVRTFIVT
jgi:hypothetical protein